MLQTLLQVGTGAVAVIGGTVLGVVYDSAAKKATVKAIKPENFGTQEEFEKAFKKRSFRNKFFAITGSVVTDVALGAGASFVITDVIPGLVGEECTETTEGTEETTTDTTSEFI